MTDTSIAESAALTLIGIVKGFGAVTALDNANLIVQSGTVHALLGENGAGKSTLMRIAFGMLQPDRGRLAVHGRPVRWRSPVDAILAGLGMVHQHFTLVPAMTVAENVELGASASRGWRFDRRTAEDRVRALGQTSGLVVEPDATVERLSVAVQQRVEILKALSRDAKILILDEPTAVLAPKEADEILRWLRVHADRGGTAILITHRLREALAIADDITVLRRGRTAFTSSRSDTDEDTLTQAMIGDNLDSATHRFGQLIAPDVAPRAVPPTPASARHALVAALDQVTATDDEGCETITATLVVNAGEIVGIAGVEGAGHHTLVRVLAGRIQPRAGRVTLPTTIAFIPEDRQRDGLVLEFSLGENVALRGAGERRGRMPWSSIRHRTAALLREFDIRAPGVTTPAHALSGGNQQRLVLARELDGQPALVVAENPTRGLDIRAAADVHERLRAACSAGAGVVLYSSDLDEVLSLATRVFAVHAGSVREVAPQKDLVGRAILGLP